MSKYPLIGAMGLEIKEVLITHVRKGFCIEADDLEKALQDAPEVYGVPSGTWCDEDDQESCDTHTARLVCIQPIKKQTKAEAALEFVQFLNENPNLFLDKVQLYQIKEILEMPE